MHSMHADAPYIPVKTLEALEAEYGPGQRHEALSRIALPLLGNGMHSTAVFAQLRAKFDPEKTDKEIWDVISWCQAKNPTPSVPMNGAPAGSGRRQPILSGPIAAPKTPMAPAEAAAQVLSGETFDEAYWFDRSTVTIPETLKDHAEMLLRVLYKAEDGINLVAKFTLNEKGKANPSGGGKTLRRDEWIQRFREAGAPCSDAGCWIRPNPCQAIGSGSNGAVTDADVTAFRFLMIESDSLPLETQLSLYAKLPLPIAAIIMSGGDSAHAWLKVDCATAEEYERLVKEFYTVAEKLGFDRANKNPSRLSRLPGVQRKHGSKGDGQQRLIFLNPSPAKYDFEKFKAHAEPIQGLIQASSMEIRIRAYMAPRPEAFTLPFLRGKTPHEGFYFRHSELTLWSGMSGHGKSTMLATVKLALMARGEPIFVASMEYRPEKLCQMLCNIVARQECSADEVVDFVKTHGHLICFADVTGEIPPQHLLNCMRSAHARYGCKTFFIDSLMRVEGLDEDYPAQVRFANLLQGIAKDTMGHVHLVAHPRKFDETTRARKMDVRGNVNLVANADNMVTMWRNMEKRDLSERGELTPEADEMMHDAEFTIEKQRETGWQGVVKLRFNRETKLFDLFKPPAYEPVRMSPPKKKRSRWA